MAALAWDGLLDGRFLRADAFFLQLPLLVLFLEHFGLLLFPDCLPKHLLVDFLNPQNLGDLLHGATALAAARFCGPKEAPPDCLLLARTALPLARAANCLAEGDLLIYNI